MSTIEHFYWRNFNDKVEDSFMNFIKQLIKSVPKILLIYKLMYLLLKYNFQKYLTPVLKFNLLMYLVL